MPASSSPKRGTVLVADDDPVMRLLMLEMLAQVGLDAIEAVDGAQAVQLAAERNPDLILLDVDMPHMDGFAACAAIRRAEVGNIRDGVSVPIVMVTGGDDLEAVTRAYEVGATDFVRRVLAERRDGGSGILLISEDLDEIQAMADRVLVLYEGRIVLECPAGDTDVTELGLAMAGVGGGTALEGGAG